LLIAAYKDLSKYSSVVTTKNTRNRFPAGMLGTLYLAAILCPKEAYSIIINTISPADHRIVWDD